MKQLAFAFIFFGLVFLGEMSAQTGVRTATLTASADGTKSNMGKYTICFPENGRKCGSRPPDLFYGMMGTADEPDWFMVGTKSPVRTKMNVLGKYNWQDKFDLPKVDPYPELRSGETREPNMELVYLEQPDNLSGREFLKPGKVRCTSSEIVKVVEENMYLLRVKDDMYDFLVLLRVDKLVPRKSVTFSWRQLPPDTTKYP